MQRYAAYLARSTEVGQYAHTGHAYARAACLLRHVPTRKIVDTSVLYVCHEEQPAKRTACRAASRVCPMAGAAALGLRITALMTRTL